MVSPGVASSSLASVEASSAAMTSACPSMTSGTTAAQTPAPAQTTAVTYLNGSLPHRALRIKGRRVILKD
jgi:hypothetical protein